MNSYFMWWIFACMNMVNLFVLTSVTSCAHLLQSISNISSSEIIKHNSKGFHNTNISCQFMVHPTAEPHFHYWKPLSGHVRVQSIQTWGKAVACHCMLCFWQSLTLKWTTRGTRSIGVSLSGSQISWVSGPVSDLVLGIRTHRQRNQHYLWDVPAACTPDTVMVSLPSSLNTGHRLYNKLRPMRWIMNNIFFFESTQTVFASHFTFVIWCTVAPESICTHLDA